MQPVVRFSDTTDGSFGLSEPSDRLSERRARLSPHPVTWLRQVHGAGVVRVDGPGDGCALEADAAVTAVPEVALSVITADCAPVLLGSPEAVGAVHAGWRGMVAGVIPEAVDSMRDLGASRITAWLGPCIRSRCYEFGADDLARVEAVLGPTVRATTAWGTSALDVTAAVRSALHLAGVDDLIDTGVCTACSPRHFSHRARVDEGRQAACIWLDR